VPLQPGKLLHRAFQSLNLSISSHDWIIKVAHTIVDLDGAEVINSAHIAEAVQNRSLDQQG